MNIHAKLYKKNGKLLPTDNRTKYNMDKFINDLVENETVEVYMEVINADGTLPQLAKLHKMIRIIARELGYSFEDMKLLIKDRCGFCIVRSVEGKEFLHCKSFGDCSKEELDYAILNCEQLAQEQNIIT